MYVDTYRERCQLRKCWRKIPDFELIYLCYYIKKGTKSSVFIVFRYYKGIIICEMTAKEGKITFDSVRQSISIITKRKSFRYGLPFLLFVLGGSFGLREWTQIRFVTQIKLVLCPYCHVVAYHLRIQNKL